jgi:hypothetical protein
MSKKDLKLYLASLKKKQLEEQIIDLYERFNEVKTFYNFVFKPNEQKLLDEAKFKISKEYFPINKRKPKMRRSVAQNLIKHFIQLGVDNYIIAELMLFNIEIAQAYTENKIVNQTSFYKSMLTSFKQVINFINENGMNNEFHLRIIKITNVSKAQNWMNFEAFEIILLSKNS